MQFVAQDIRAQANRVGQLFLCPLGQRAVIAYFLAKAFQVHLCSQLPTLHGQQYTRKKRARESTLLPPSDREDTGRAGQRDWPEPVCLEPQTAWDRKRTLDPPRGPSDRQNVGRVGSHDQAS